MFEISDPSRHPRGETPDENLNSFPEEHPALARFNRTQAFTERLLLVQAAAGTGRVQFAQSWLAGEHPHELHDWSAPGLDVPRLLNDMIKRLADNGQLRVAVLLSARDSIWLYASRFPCQVAHHADLLLNEDEITFLLTKHHLSEKLRAAELSRLVGGWLEPLHAMMREPDYEGPALRAMRVALSAWMSDVDPDHALAPAAFLTAFDQETVQTFFESITDHAPLWEDLVNAGLIQRDPSGTWFMPRLVQQVLQDSMRSGSTAHVTVFEDAALSAAASTHNLETAVDSAIQHRKWRPLESLVLDRWVELFVSNPQRLGAVASKLPRLLADRTGLLWLALRLLSASSSENLPLPTVEPRYHEDLTAQRLRQRTENPSPRTPGLNITEMFLEVCHLRLAGHYQESADVGRRMRRVLAVNIADHRINRYLAAFAELHAGISLQLAGFPVEARWAFESTETQTRALNVPFLTADVTGKLALSYALDGDLGQAQHWLDEHTELVDELKWGRKMVRRPAQLARALIALHQLDFSTFFSAVEELPETVDTDEFWSIHAYLQACRQILDGEADPAYRRLTHLRLQRPYAARAPLHTQMLNEAVMLSHLADPDLPLVNPHGNEFSEHTGPIDERLQALLFLRHGETDKVLALLSGDHPHPAGRRWHNLAVYLEHAARNPEGPTDEILKEIVSLHHTSGTLLGLGLLMQVPGWQNLDQLLPLPEEDQARLQRFSTAIPPVPKNRPRLTPREIELLGYLRKSMTRRDIAEATFRSENTVKSQLRSLYRKLDVNDADQALAVARRWGW